MNALKLLQDPLVLQALAQAYFVERHEDVHTAFHNKVLALGIPGVTRSMCKEAYYRHLHTIPVMKGLFAFAQNFESDVNEAQRANAIQILEATAKDVARNGVRCVILTTIDVGGLAETEMVEVCPTSIYAINNALEAAKVK